ncbi:squalene/phytoene synthase family protein, partial [Streptomyces sp. NPDC001027]|uniref:squalene/phytoene synthase family protein n=1 Tax=Streptomyces sp. NPDC001027 TaxID=3154771 RepID=UPI0033317112
RVRAALEAFAHLTRGVYREAAPGIAMLDPVSRPCIRTAFVLYGGILDAVADDGYTVLHRRSVVPRRRRAAVAADGLVRLLAARASARAGRRTVLPPTSAPAGGRLTASGTAAAEPLHEEVV